MHPILSDQAKFRLYEIHNLIMDCFNSEIQEMKRMSKKLSKLISAFDYFDKTLLVLSTSGGISINSFTSAVGVPVGIASANFSLFFVLVSVSSLTTGIIMKLSRTKKRNIKKWLC